MIYAADNEDEAVQLSDRYAPEHLELHVRNADDFAAKLTNYGSLFIGEETTVAYGDKTIGTNHILPTSRAARYTGGVWVGKFLKTCTYQRMTPQASVEVAEVTERQCLLENMLAHAITARVRIERYGSASTKTAAQLLRKGPRTDAPFRHLRRQPSPRDVPGRWWPSCGSPTF